MLDAEQLQRIDERAADVGARISPGNGSSSAARAAGARHRQVSAPSRSRRRPVARNMARDQYRVLYNAWTTSPTWSHRATHHATSSCRHFLFRSEFSGTCARDRVRSCCTAPAASSLVDPGPSSTLPALRQALAAAGIAHRGRHAILLTHIHLDHAGATGTLVRENPACASTCTRTVRRTWSIHRGSWRARRGL